MQSCTSNLVELESIVALLYTQQTFYCRLLHALGLNYVLFDIQCKQAYMVREMTWCTTGSDELAGQSA